MSSIQDFWPRIEEAININNDSSQPNSASHVQCPICMEDVAVTSFPPVPERQGDLPGADPTLGEVLLCGHVLCQGCRMQNEHSSPRHNNRTCPMCRTSLQCIDCGKPSLVMPIPKEGPPSSVPAIMSDGGRCRECKAIAGFEQDIHEGEWPEGLEDLEPGFVPLFYHLVGKLEQQRFIVSENHIIEAFATIVRDEFGEMLAKRREVLLDKHHALEGQTPWFGDESHISTAAIPSMAALPGDDRQRRQRNGGLRTVPASVPAVPSGERFLAPQETVPSGQRIFASQSAVPSGQRVLPPPATVPFGQQVNPRAMMLKQLSGEDLEAAAVLTGMNYETLVNLRLGFLHNKMMLRRPRGAALNQPVLGQHVVGSSEDEDSGEDESGSEQEADGDDSGDYFYTETDYSSYGEDDDDFDNGEDVEMTPAHDLVN
ncbi:hypothetical protein FSPOR_3270 [Fusarium sporotrichioides]|uniref:RING-type domain-containing protein n=1 Tax=Fusarium sporotrichioides TaxID=5514 RepID=A0A395SGG6_FUSSP|nr:hypothetical protein FSPOR_3270 [Fusarium sporotrichioides]